LQSKCELIQGYAQMKNVSPSINLAPSLPQADAAFEKLRSLDVSTVWSEGTKKGARIRGTVLGREAAMTTFLTPDRDTAAASDHFHWQSRMLAHYRSKESPSEVLAEHHESLSTKPAGKVRNFVRGMTYVPGQFNPAVAAAIIREFDARRVFDPCSGWGDRLAGALASPYVEEYVGVDPNSLLITGYAAQIRRYGGKKRCTMICGAAEDTAGIKRDWFDLAFTSPPYFNAEYYSDDPEQSLLRYPTLEKWVARFLKPMLTKAVDCVKPRGFIVINIANLVRGKKITPLCEYACDIMEDILGCEFKYLWGMRINDRQHLGSLNEPVLVWEKHYVR
jgi:hypothetical protein